MTIISVRPSPISKDTILIVLEITVLVQSIASALTFTSSKPSRQTILEFSLHG